MNIEKLIECIHSKSCIWNQAHPDHQNRFVMTKMWAEVATEMNSDKEQVQKKWKYLRDYFRNELKKIPKKRSGDAGGIIIKSSWQYFAALTFLKDQLQNRKSTGNLQDQEIYETNNDENSTSENTQLQTEGNNTQKDIENEDAIQDVSLTEDENNSLFRQNVCDQPTIEFQHEPRVDLINRKRKRNTNNNIGAELLNLEKQKLELIKNKRATKRVEMNDDQMFFNSLLPFVSDIPTNRKLLFRSKIQEIVHQFAFESSNTTACSNPYTNSNSPVSFLHTSTPHSSDVSEFSYIFDNASNV